MKHWREIGRYLVTAMFAVCIASAAHAEEGKPHPGGAPPGKSPHGPKEAKEPKAPKASKESKEAKCLSENCEFHMNQSYLHYL